MDAKHKLHPDVVISILTLVFSGVLLFEIHGYPRDVQMFPGIFLYLFMTFMVITLIKGIRKTVHPEKADSSEWWCRFETVKNPLLTAAFVIMFVALIRLLGFYIAAAFYLLGSMHYFGSKNWKINLLVTASLLVFCFLLFDLALSVSLPEGLILEAVLG